MAGGRRRRRTFLALGLFNPPSPTGDTRITQALDRRITQTGDVRVVH